MTAESRAPDATPASLGELGMCLWHARWTLGAWMLAGLVLAGSIGLVLPARFTATATILIEQESTTSLLGDLASLVPLSSAPVTASELSVLESRTLAEKVLEEGRDASGSWDPRDERHVGLATRVDDEAVAPLALVRRKFLDPPPLEEPLVLPARGVYARVTSATPDAPTLVRLEFLDDARVRMTRAGMLAAFSTRPSRFVTLSRSSGVPSGVAKTRSYLG